MSRRVLAAAVAAAVMGMVGLYYLLVWHDGEGAHRTSRYVGSAACAGCHPLRATSQAHTLHTRIFRPVTDPSQILGDFSRPNPLVTFKKSQITHVVGSRWEQVYMFEKDGEFYPFPAKWMVSTRRWVPYKVHSWLKTPASTRCNGCHTTGYSPVTRRFVEYGVRCEACHGPGSRHVAHMTMIRREDCRLCHGDRSAAEFRNDLVVSVKSAVCGQCHTRGKTVIPGRDGGVTAFNFPLRYLRGESNATFQPSRPKEDGTNTSDWWGNRLARNRHQEFADFSLSAHSRALKDLHTRKNPHGSQPPGEECLRCHSQDYRSAPPEAKPTYRTAREGLTCVTCHEPHGLDRVAPSMKEGARRCGECHLASFAKGERHLSPDHFPCPSDRVTCVDCHMPKIVKSGGTFTIRSHAFKIVPPEATRRYGMPNSCQNGGCHADRSVTWAIRAYHAFYDRNATLRRQVEAGR